MFKFLKIVAVVVVFDKIDAFQDTQQDDEHEIAYLEGEVAALEEEISHLPLGTCGKGDICEECLNIPAPHGCIGACPYYYPDYGACCPCRMACIPCMHAQVHSRMVNDLNIDLLVLSAYDIKEASKTMLQKLVTAYNHPSKLLTMVKQLEQEVIVNSTSQDVTDILSSLTAEDRVGLMIFAGANITQAVGIAKLFHSEQADPWNMEVLYRIMNDNKDKIRKMGYLFRKLQQFDDLYRGQEISWNVMSREFKMSILIEKLQWMEIQGLDGRSYFFEPIQSTAPLANLLWLFKPCGKCPVGRELKAYGHRIDSTNSPGYMMCDLTNSHNEILGIYSYGIGEHDYWAQDVRKDVGGDVHLYQYDCTVRLENDTHTTFVDTCLAPHDGIGGSLYPHSYSGTETHKFSTVSYDLITNNHVDVPTGSLVLKIDAEGAEWGVLEEMSSRILQKFDQISWELHRITEPIHLDTKIRLAKKILDAGFEVVWVRGRLWNEYGTLYDSSLQDFLDTFHLRDDEFLFPPEIEITYRLRQSNDYKGVVESNSCPETGNFTVSTDDAFCNCDIACWPEPLRWMYTPE
eukprot:gene437-889_t